MERRRAPTHVHKNFKVLPLENTSAAPAAQDDNYLLKTTRQPLIHRVEPIHLGELGNEPANSPWILTLLSYCSVLRYKTCGCVLCIATCAEWSGNLIG
jgi:hypothetical protein